MICRRRHADVLEWAWFVNSFGDDGVYSQLMNGDKDSFLLAFALANKTGDYYQVSGPPSCKPKMQLHAQSIQAKKKENKPKTCQYSLGLSLTHMSHASAAIKQNVNRDYNSSNTTSSQVVLSLGTCIDGTGALLMSTLNLALCFRLQVPEWVRLCLHNVPQVRPCSLLCLQCLPVGAGSVCAELGFALSAQACAIQTAHIILCPVHPDSKCCIPICN